MNTLHTCNDVELMRYILGMTRSTMDLQSTINYLIMMKIMIKCHPRLSYPVFLWVLVAEPTFTAFKAMHHSSL